jgi:hypothetical protein
VPLKVWRLKGVRRNGKQGDFPILSKEEYWSGIQKCKGNIFGWAKL